MGFHPAELHGRHKALERISLHYELVSNTENSFHHQLVLPSGAYKFLSVFMYHLSIRPCHQFYCRQEADTPLPETQTTQQLPQPLLHYHFISAHCQLLISHNSLWETHGHVTSHFSNSLHLTGAESCKIKMVSLTMPSLHEKNPGIACYLSRNE